MRIFSPNFGELIWPDFWPDFAALAAGKNLWKSVARV
jgi:hypothetical protein